MASTISMTTTSSTQDIEAPPPQADPSGTPSERDETRQDALDALINIGLRKWWTATYNEHSNIIYLNHKKKTYTSESIPKWQYYRFWLVAPVIVLLWIFSISASAASNWTTLGGDVASASSCEFGIIGTDNNNEGSSSLSCDKERAFAAMQVFSTIFFSLAFLAVIWMSLIPAQKTIRGRNFTTTDMARLVAILVAIGVFFEIIATSIASSLITEIRKRYEDYGPNNENITRGATFNAAITNTIFSVLFAGYIWCHAGYAGVGFVYSNGMNKDEGTIVRDAVTLVNEPMHWWGSKPPAGDDSGAGSELGRSAAAHGEHEKGSRSKRSTENEKTGKPKKPTKAG